MLELNELCPPLLDRFMAAGDLPAFSRLRAESACFVTEAEEPQEHLNPWIQWVTAHTGAGYEDHGVFKLGDGARLQLPTLADVVAGAGGTVWMCGPMNVVPTEPVHGSWLPDPWNPSHAPVPEDLEPFSAFVRANVQEHTNVSARLSSARVRAVPRGSWLGTACRPPRSAPPPPSWSVSACAVATAGSEPPSSTGSSGTCSGACWRRDRPQLATYFSNTTAHYQHLYWRHMDPDPFPLAPTAAEVARFGGAVRFGYQEMDRLVGRALAMAGPDTAIVFCTAISQQPYVLKDDDGGSRFHRPFDMADLVQRLGVADVAQVAPVMAEQFHLFFGADEQAAAAEARLATVAVAGRPVFELRRTGTDLFAGCAIKDDVDPDALLTVDSTATSLRFHDHLYRAETAKSGYHHPDGALWIRVPGREGSPTDERVPLRAVAPTVLDLLGLTPPPSMRTPPVAVAV